MVVNEVVSLTKEERENIIIKGFQNCKRFDTSVTIDKIEEIYKRVISYQ
jgi:hypothetical protein